jgi:hypothetical protein
MIRDHAFNCRWWGGRVGILDDARFFEEPDAVRRRLLAPYEWVEFRCPIEAAPDPWRLANAGFAQADTQLRFRIGLKLSPTAPRLERDLPVRFADQEPFKLPDGRWPDFPHERFRRLPGATPEMIRERYASWARALLARSPEWCAEAGPVADPQGWFLAEAEHGHLHLALALLRPGAEISGIDLYSAALSAFASRGARRGEARFSIENRAVHNIYARLGAVFVEAIGCWLWIRR